MQYQQVLDYTITIIFDYQQLKFQVFTDIPQNVYIFHFKIFDYNKEKKIKWLVTDHKRTHPASDFDLAEGGTREAGPSVSGEGVCRVTQLYKE